jgi:hypothetical protein
MRMLLDDGEFSFSFFCFWITGWQMNYCLLCSLASRWIPIWSNLLPSLIFLRPIT